MERVQKKFLKNEIKNNLRGKEIVKELNPKIQKIIKLEKISEEETISNLSSLEDTSNELFNCENCLGINKCPNHIKGYVYYPQKKESRLSFSYIACKELKEKEAALEKKGEEAEITKARIKDIDKTDGNRIKVLKWLDSFYKNYDETKCNKGIYLHGSFGSGKTFLLAALLNELHINKNVNFEIIYFPKLLRNLKDNFNLLDSKVNYYSNVEILLIDDIGAEKVSDWGRDEILGTILQERMNNHLTTFFTSNLTIDELEKHLSLSKDSVDVVKARRIIERIKQLTDDVELISINRRN